MPGTVAGGLKAKEKNLARNPYHYQMIGKSGGQVKGLSKGFASDKVSDKDGLTGRMRASLAGSVGGKISRRPKRNNYEN